MRIILPRPSRLAAVIAATGLLAVVALAVHHRSDQGETPSYVPQDVLGPVLLVPGYGGGTSGLQSLAARLQAAGRTAVIVPAVGDGTGDLRSQARQLQTVVAQQRAGGAPSVDVIGYSAGGVVARIWAQELGGVKVARRVVTLGSPHHGTKVAKLAATFESGACTTACRQLEPGSDLLDHLTDAPGGPRWVSLWTDQDRTVTPPTTAKLERAVNVDLQKICPGARISHSQLPTDRLAQSVVLSALSVAGLSQAPDPAECAARSG